MHSRKCKVWECRVSSVELKRSREVRGGYGRLRAVTERETENSEEEPEKGRRHPTEKDGNVKCQV